MEWQKSTHCRHSEDRYARQMHWLLLLSLSVFLATPAQGKDWAIYQSVNDPPGQPPTRILVEELSFKYGGLVSQNELRGSDVGFQGYLRKTKGGAYVASKPIIFPDTKTSLISFGDYRCSVRGFNAQVDVLCRSVTNTHLFHSRLVDGGLVSFELPCEANLNAVCRFELAEGSPVRP